MIWLTWRMFRVPAVSVFAALGLIGILLLVTGLDMRGETDFSGQDFMFGGTLLVLYLLPAVLGVFWGVPLVTRELETGTHSLVWNQTVSRKRWLATKLGFGMVAAMVAAGLLSLGVTWWASPMDTLASQGVGDPSTARIAPLVFAVRGIVPIGYAAFAFVLGVALGIVLRRTVAAMAVTLVVFTAVMVAIPFFVRPYVLPATDEMVTITSSNIRQISGNDAGVVESITVEEHVGGWGLTNETVDSAGNPVSPLPSFVYDCLPGPGKAEPMPSPRNVGECFSQLNDHGYRQHLAYQPASHFWPLQWIELGIFLAMSALLTWFCFRRVRHLS